MLCIKCKTELSDNIKFCPECGKATPKPKQVSEQKVKELPYIMTINELAEFLKVSRCKVYDLINNYGLPVFMVGSHKRFLTSKVIEWTGGNL